MTQTEADRELVIKTLRSACDAMQACRNELNALDFGRPPRDANHRNRLAQRLTVWKKIVDNLAVVLDEIDASEQGVNPCERRAIRKRLVVLRLDNMDEMGGEECSFSQSRYTA